MPTATKAASRLSSPESEDTARADTPPVHATGGFKKRPAAEAGEAKPAKRSAVAAPQAGASVARLQAAWRGFRVRGEGVAALARSQSEARREHARSERTAAVDARTRRPEYRQVARCCPEARVRELAELDERLARLVGMDALREYCADLRRDCLARVALGDAEVCPRNVLISGAMGTGKKLAAEMVCALLRALGVAKGCTTTTTTLDQMVLDVRRDITTVVVDGLPQSESLSEATKSKVDAVLGNYPRHCFVFLGATHGVEVLHGAVPHFRKAEPAWLRLPNLTPAQLAAIAASQLTASGYALAPPLGEAELQAAICSTWPRDVLAQRNAHLAKEIVQRAVSHRNSRLPLSRLLCSSLTLQAADLGLEAAGLPSLLALRHAVQAEVDELVGMAPLKHFLKELRAKVEYVERGGDPRLLEGCLNIVLTGNPGAGKTTAARLLFRALRGYGLLRKEVFVERNALELKGTHIGWTCPQVKEMVQGALGGCLFLDEAYALSGGGKDGDRGDSFSDEALRTLLTEVENNRNSLCVVLAGYKDAMMHLMAADPGLVRRFPTALHLEDYTPAQLAAIARQTAHTKYGLAFGAGLEVRLAAHVAQRHASEVPKHNAGLAVSLVEAAVNRLAVRLASAAPPPPPPPTEAAAAVAAAAAGSNGGSGSAAAAAAAVPPPLSLITLEPSDFAIKDGCGGEGARSAALAAVRALPSHLAPARDALLQADASLLLAARHAAAAPLALRGATRLAIGAGSGGAGGAEGARVAALLLQLLQAHGVATGGLVVRSALPLVGDSAVVVVAKLQDMVEAASGGLLLLQDAGALAVDPAAARALAAALAPLPPRAAVVLAGDALELAALLSGTAGLAAAFPPPLLLPPPTAAQVAAQVAARAAELGLAPPADLAARLLPLVTRRMAPAAAAAGTSRKAGDGGGGSAELAGGLAEVLLQEAVGRLALRCGGDGQGAADAAVEVTLHHTDFGLA